MTEIPRFRQEISRFQSAQKPQSLNRRISSGQTYRPYICADADAYRCFGPQMFTDTDGYRCFGPQMFADVYVCRCFGPQMFTDADAYRCFGPQMFTDTDGYGCLWFTDAYAERMPMHKV